MAQGVVPVVQGVVGVLQGVVGRCCSAAGHRRALFQIVLGLGRPGGPSKGGKSQNGAKIRRFGINRPQSAF